MSDETPTPYAEVLEVIDNLPTIVREARRRKGMTTRQVAATLNLAPSTVTRAEQGKGVHTDTLTTLLHWAGT